MGLGSQSWRASSWPQNAPSSRGDRQTDGQSDAGSADLEVTTGSQGNRTQTEGSEDVSEEGHLNLLLEGQGQKRAD